MKTLIVDGVNYSSYMTGRDYTVAYSNVIGPNSCMTLDGKIHEDVLAEKAVLTIPLKPLSSADLSIITNSQTKKSVLATYYDLKTNADKVTFMKVTTPAASLIFENSLSTLWGTGNTGLTLTLEEV